MKKKSALALTLGLGLVVGSLTMGEATIVRASQRPAGIENMQMGHENVMRDKNNHQEMLDLLQINEQTFKQEIDSGKSLAKIAADHHVSRQAVVDLVAKNINQQIDNGVKEKSLTTEQATEMKATRIEKAEKIVDRQLLKDPKMHDKQVLQEMLVLLQVDEQTFKQEVDSGKSLTEIAAAHHVSRQAVIDLIVKNMNEQTDKGVIEKRITPQQGKEMKTNAIEKAQAMVDRQPMEFDKMQARQNHQEMLALLQIDQQTFKQEVASGKSLAEIAAAHHVSRQAVIDLVVKNMNQQIDKGVAEKHITLEQANEMKTHAVEKAQEMIDKNMMEHPAKPQR